MLHGRFNCHQRSQLHCFCVFCVCVFAFVFVFCVFVFVFVFLRDCVVWLCFCVFACLCCTNLVSSFRDNCIFAFSRMILVHKRMHFPIFSCPLTYRMHRSQNYSDVTWCVVISPQVVQGQSTSKNASVSRI